MEAAADIPGFTPLAVIPLSCDSQEGPPEWAMIELQGELERRDPVQPGQEFAFGQLKHSSTVRALPHSKCLSVQDAPAV
jgi:hypothetical protein